MITRKFLVIAVVVLLTAVVSAVNAYTPIVNTTGTFKVAVNDLGYLCNSNDLGFMRVSDKYDPIAPGTPRESWGIAADFVSGFADPAYYGITNLVVNSASYTAHTAFTSSFLMSGATRLLRIDQSFSFANENILLIDTVVTNVSAATRYVKYRRNVDWDILPDLYDEYSTEDALVGRITNASYTAFDKADPLVAFDFSSGAGGGTYGPADNGAAFDYVIGNLTPKAKYTFKVYHGISKVGQTQAQLRTQLHSLGAEWIASGTGNDGKNSTVLGVNRSLFKELVNIKITLEDLASVLNKDLGAVKIQILASDKTTVLDTDLNRLDLIPTPYVVTKELLPGDYFIRVSALKWLTKTVPISVSLGFEQDVNILLLNGDINGDNKINVSDYNRMKANWFKIGD